VPCTKCNYCASHCPMELPISLLLEYYNEHKSNAAFLAPMAVEALPEEKRPDKCIGCRSCEEVCPQQIKISEVFAEFVQMPHMQE
ncbi:MAG: 4Fe-4S dicluster domain-containing protein, partial [Mogibacterium sp.]|nr:4Fe-4S dicluster domain-containing protein [Mogibacterium sp.]